MSLSEKITIQIHPRAFSAFGEDLVTSDFVAVTELVKNSYDAFALKVNIVFSVDDDGEPYIQIIDDGCGMIRDTIVNAWATIATPYKKKNPIIVRMIDGKEETRVVSGNKGLGRFSAARLGNQMRMITKHIDGECIEASFDWTSFNSIENIADCYMTLKTLRENPFANNSNETGTIIEIRDLNSIWDALKIYQLKDELSRLVSPFEQVNNFDINIITSTTNDLIKITPNDFINNPIYKISGYVDSSGSVIWNYTFNDGDSKRNLSGEIEWNERNYTNYSEFTTYRCGGFTFEIRAWELNSDSIAALSGRFNIGKKEIRKNISMYKGISIYRDSVLVLPKSESSRDWLGLDAKRISQIGRRLSTSQIVGIVNITNQNNPQIKDTTDREKIVDSIEYRQLKEVLYVIVDKLQSERLKDKNEEMKRDELTDVIEPLSSKSLLETVQSAVKKGESSESILEYVRDYDQTNEKQLNELNKRLVYYAQTASLGSIAIVIMHEFLTGMTAIKRFLNKTAEYLDSFDKRTQDYLDDANKSHKRIVEVTNSFAPLYRRDLRKKENRCNLKEVVYNSIRLIKSKKISKNISFKYEIDEALIIPMNGGELQTVFINLFDNACYWIKDSKKSNQQIIISLEENSDPTRITVVVSDTGSGILTDEMEKIFVPGITSKPNGIGMGLVIVSEILSYYKGKIGVRVPGDLDGATFVFDIPRK